MKVSELTKDLRSKGAKLVAHGKEHDVWELNGRTTRIPRHQSKELPTGTLSKILKDLRLR